MSPASIRMKVHRLGVRIELYSSKIYMLKFYFPGPQNVTLFGNRIIAFVIN